MLHVFLLILLFLKCQKSVVFKKKLPLIGVVVRNMILPPFALKKKQTKKLISPSASVFAYTTKGT